MQREITVVTGGPSPSTGATGIAVSAPAEGASVSGAIAIAGTAAPNTALTVTATPTAAPPVSFTIARAGKNVPVKAALPSAPKPLSLAADASGAFAGTMSLGPGSWSLVFAAGGGASPVTRTVIVPPPSRAGRLAGHCRRTVIPRGGGGWNAEGRHLGRHQPPG